MKEKIKYTAIAVLLILSAVFSIYSYTNDIHYTIDTVRGWYIDITESLSPGSNFTIISQEKYKKYIKPYKNMPGDFTYCHNILIYKSEKKTTLRDLSHEAIKFTSYFSTSKLRSAIRRYNAIKENELPAGLAVVIPGTVPAMMVDIRNTAKPKIFHTRGLYFTGTSAGSKKMLSKIEHFKKLGINAIVFDAKDITGIVNYHSSVPFAQKYNTHEKRTIGNIRLLIRTLKKNGIYSIARVSVFQDRLVYKKEPSLAIRSRNGGKWNAGRGEKWCDPTSRTIQDYNISLAVELADMGVDEIQFDYIRFPTGGEVKDAVFRYDFGRMKREESIAHFLKRAYRKISKRNTLLSIDIFGVVAWGKEIDIYKTGQRIERLSQYCDVISPMLYPSHFSNDFDGKHRPGDNPYHFIFNGCKKVLELSKKKIAVRPWLQAFKWRVSNYNKHYILKQIKASDDSGARGYLFWNAANEYETVLAAMDSLKNKKGMVAANNALAESGQQEN